MTTTPNDPYIEAAFHRMLQASKKRNEETEAKLATAPDSIQCAIHTATTRNLNRELSFRDGKPAYDTCPACRLEAEERAIADRVHRAGVPLNLCSATLESWVAESEADESHLEQIKAFIRAKRGFLVMLGDLGTGKTHLAAAAVRYFKSAWFIKQSELLRKLRDTYRDKAAIDPVDRAQDADLLVLDEMGLSAGGRDELPMLHDVLDHRYNELKPTILTGNITLNQLQSVVGERMADRLRESAFAVLVFGGTSRRREARDKYFEGME